jgi:hypothetical protein
MADPDPSRSDLPAPYASPWGQLAAALRAVLASLRLKLRELWRRNASGELSVPGFWPQPLAALFWPLLLALLLALVVLLGRRLPQGFSGPAAGGGRPETSGIESPQTTVTPARAPSPGTETLDVQEPEMSLDPLAPPAPVVPLPPAADMVQAPPAPPRLELDPLLALLADDDPEHLIASARPEPAERLLVLTMKPAYLLPSVATRRRWAERWQERASALGYGRLQLVDGSGRLLARGALVGSGMILLDPDPSA